MPLRQLPEPESLTVRLVGIFKGSITVLLLIPLLIFLNGVQMLSLLTKLFSSKVFRKINRGLASFWWRILYVWVEKLNGIDVEFLGDDAPALENVLVISNHQEMTDVPILFHFGDTKKRLGDLKWFVKDVVKHVPGVGWGLRFLDCLFVKRDWTADKDNIDRVFSKIIKEKIPLWIITFVEGTRSRPKKIAKSREYANKNNLKPMTHVMYPRTKGFAATTIALRGHLDAVYDLTIMYTDGTPSLWQWLKGYPSKMYVNVRRFAMEDLPESETELSDWLVERFYAKDRRLEEYYETGVLEHDESAC